LNISPGFAQNWLDENQPMAYVEEEVPQDSPLEPTNSFIFFVSNILTLPLTFGHHSLEGDFSLELEGCPVEEEIPIVEHE
jgi:hypothetical protein